ncbi:MAG: septum formation initiator family protein [Patescibacteria group bacterium]
MRNQERKRALRRALTSRGVIVFEILLIAFLVVGITKEVVRRLSLREEVATLEQQIAELEAQNRTLGEYVASINTDSFREREARKRLNVQRPGESLLILPETRQLSTTDSEVATHTDAGGTSNSQRWWKFFFRPARN